MQKSNIMYLLCIDVHCASVLSHTSDGWRHAFTYRWIKSIIHYLLRTYLYAYLRTYLCIYVFLFVYTGFRCSILYESYSVSEYNYLVNEYICLVRKKEKVKLDSYRGGGGLKLQCHVQ